MRELLAIALVLMVIASGCITSGKEATSTTPPASPVKEAKYSPTKTASNSTPADENLSVVDASNLFGIELYKELSGGEENVFISPFSVFTALSMVYEGARGETAREMRAVLHLPGNDSLRRNEFRTLLLSITSPSGAEVDIANALWVQKGYPVRDTYVSVIRQYYLGEVQGLDFKGNPGGAERTINRWVAEKTHGRIRNIVASLDPNTGLIITNAVYFKANWTLRFNPDETHNGSFTLPSGRRVRTLMMTRLGKFNYAETDEFQALEMPYAGSNFSMVIILPKKTDGLKEIEKNLTPKLLSTILSSFKKEEVEVTIPKFKFEGQYSLAKTLQGMGMRRAFSNAADFSGISDRPLTISAVLHKTFISVAENGTEAAAATAVVMVAGVAPGEQQKYKVFKADHPFLFLIIDRKTGLILFIGRLDDPRG